MSGIVKRSVPLSPCRPPAWQRVSVGDVQSQSIAKKVTRSRVLFIARYAVIFSSQCQLLLIVYKKKCIFLCLCILFSRHAV